MKKLGIALLAVFLVSFTIIADTPLSKDCKCKEFKMYGKVKFVNNFPDVKVQYVENFPDLKVKFVENFPDQCGEWQVVENFPDVKVQIVENFPDLKVKVVNNFPGIP
jgi:hypothetical protein